MTADEVRAKWKLDDETRATLLRNLKSKLPELKALLAEAEDHWAMEDAVYRFYYGSFKVYRVQQYTERIVAALRSLLPDQELDQDFLTLLKEGTGKTFELEHNQDWLRHTRTMVEAFFHALYFLRMACKYAGQWETPPQVMPSGWAALLCLYRLR